jgi:hypothetical protein
MILETFFLTEEKRLIRTQNFREEKTFRDLRVLGGLGLGGSCIISRSVIDNDGECPLCLPCLRRESWELPWNE